ncbi:MOSC domain-containing protein [Anaerobacillus sp. MEB173]|uniref:MOSC domain-containing protein n=1 Tax=Anaerobacillus sp. MEB173 TaxID=3383345 RepID=UPI003F9368EE
MTVAKLTSIQVGKPQWRGEETASNPLDQLWYSAILKRRVEGEVKVGKTNLEGDGQADLENHGGVDKAVFAYPERHYQFFKKKFNLTKLPFGSFGENLTINNLIEEDICIGDTYQIGDVILQVSQPRQPCWKLSRHFRIKEMAYLIQTTGKTGWYFRVLHEGQIEQGQTITLVERPNPDWTVAFCNEIMHTDKKNYDLAQKLASCPELATSWVNTLTSRVNNKADKDPSARLFGPNDK